jgi:hydrogenase maturation factor
MNSLKDYIRLYSKFKTDTELAQDTGLSKEKVRSIKRQINLELLTNKTRKGKY